MICGSARFSVSSLMAVSLAALLMGCAVGPDFSEPAAPPAEGYTEPGQPEPSLPQTKEQQQHFALGKKISGDWWQLFRSDRLNGVLQQAIGGNLSLVAAQTTLAQAQQVAVQAGGILYPQIDLAAGATREQATFAFVGQNIKSPPFNLYSIGPTVSYALDPFGGNRRQLEEEQALAHYADYQLDAAYLALTGNTVSEALTIAAVRTQIDAVNSIIADDQRNLELIESERRAGEASQIDVESAASQLAADRTLLPPLRQQLSVARHALSFLVGRSPTSWTPPDFSLDEFTLPAELPLSLPAELVRRRPDILAAEAQLHAASAAVGVATAQLYPNISLSAQFTQETLTTSTLFNPASSVWSVGANLLAPVFHGGALEAQKQAAVDAFQGALATYKQTVLAAFSQVADVMEALAHDAEMLEAQRHALESAEESLRLTRMTYQYGNVGVLLVLDAQRLAERARLGYVQAEAQRYIDTAQLFTAMGGGWWDWKKPAGPMNASVDAGG